MFGGQKLNSSRLGLSNAFDASNKHVVFVKLTDSSLEALQNYIRNHTSKSSSPTSWNKPTIQFSKHSGTFTVPIYNEDRSSLQQQKFTFTIEEQNGPQGSFECLESRRPGSLESLGPIKDKVQVQASDESYTRFGERMSDVKKENEKRTTRYLDKTGGNGLVTGNSHNKIVSTKQQLLAKKNSSNFSLNQRANCDFSSRFSHSASAMQSVSSRGQLSGIHPMLDKQKHKRAQTNSEIMKRPLRERIVHLLAVRPYKKPELVDRINRDGIREKDKKDLFLLVKQVSTMKDNTYHLQRHIWNDVSEDWPFYTEEERQLFRRRKPQNLTPPGSDGSTGSVASGHSSSSSHPASPQPTLKRPASSSYLNGPSGDASPISDHHSSGSYAPTAKKKRVSNYIRQAGISPMSNSRSPNPMLSGSAGGLGGFEVVGSPRGSSVSASNHVMHLATESGESKTNAWLNKTTNQESTTPPRGSAASMLAATSNGLGSENSNSSSKNRFSRADYLTNFVKITNSEQRRIYKLEFNKDYKRYMVLHGHVSRVSERFSKLQNKLSQTPETSAEYQRLKDAIVQDYQTTKTSQYKRYRDEFQYLHNKLEHIKKLVHDFDTRCMNKGNGSGSNSSNSATSEFSSRLSPLAASS